MNKKTKDQDSGIQNSTRKKPKVIAITSGKGGVGKSNISVNIAIGLAKQGNKVLLLDADLGLANIDILLGLQAKYNLSHVMEGKRQLNEIILTGPGGIQIVPSSSGTEYMTHLSPMEHAGIIDSFNEITDELDYMIIDTAAGISDTVLSFARSAQKLIVVVCDEPTSLTDAYALIKVMRNRYEWQNFHILANMVRKPKDGKLLFNKLLRVAEQFLDVNIDYLGAVPFDDHVHDSVKKQVPILLSYPDSSASKVMIKLCEEVNNWSYSDSIGGSTSFFIERLISEG